MSMVFKAGGLSVGEGAFLMACANHTDAKGYVIAHMQQIADEMHMSLRTAQAKRAELEKRKLVRAAPRFSPKNGAQIANLFRINLDLLKSMERKRTDYGPSLVEELTFEKAPEENPSSDPRRNLPPLPRTPGRSRTPRQISPGQGRRNLPPFSLPLPHPLLSLRARASRMPLTHQRAQGRSERERLRPRGQTRPGLRCRRSGSRHHRTAQQREGGSWQRTRLPSGDRC
ncbi:hypothetical protein AB0L67_41350 [Streptomyces flaveolus]|uniref:hypothetical protein n=1 Tax=Streptomyces flaveolus TaxID=67297 RepID=UPI00343644A1